MKNYGFLLEAIRDVREYILGASNVPYVPFNELADWRPHAPKYEPQVLESGEEPHSCTLVASQNQIETLEHFLYGELNDYAEAFNYPRIPIRPERGGADPHATYENIRHEGLVLERDFPTPKTLASLKDISRASKSIQAKGLYWLKKNDFRHEWLWKTRPNNYKELLKDALHTSPLTISVEAWIEENGVYISTGARNNHLVNLLYIGDYLNFKDAYYIQDSYDMSFKWLHPNHNILVSKRIWLNRRTKSASKSMIQLLQDVIKRLTMKPTLSREVEKYLGKGDPTPRDPVDDSVACVDVITTILAPFGIPYMVSTIKFDEWLSDPKNGFRQTDTLAEDTIVISPTEGDRIGHVGCTVVQNGSILIASNNSSGPYKGQITPNYTGELWNRRFGKEKGLKVKYYTKV